MNRHTALYYGDYHRRLMRNGKYRLMQDWVMVAYQTTIHGNVESTKPIDLCFSSKLPLNGYVIPKIKRANHRNESSLEQEDSSLAEEASNKFDKRQDQQKRRFYFDTNQKDNIEKCRAQKRKYSSLDEEEQQQPRKFRRIENKGQISKVNSSVVW